MRSVSVSSSVRDDPTIEEIRELAGGALKVVGPERIDAIARTDVPQGVVATADPLPAADLDELLRAPDAFLVALDGVSDPAELGCGGASGRDHGRDRARAASTSQRARHASRREDCRRQAIEYLPIAVAGGIPNALEHASRAGCWTIGLDVSADDRSLFDLELADQPLVLVLGSEGRGLARLTSARCEVLVSIPIAARSLRSTSQLPPRSRVTRSVDVARHYDPEPCRVSSVGRAADL